MNPSVHADSVNVAQGRAPTVRAPAPAGTRIGVPLSPVDEALIETPPGSPLTYMLDSVTGEMPTSPDPSPEPPAVLHEVSSPGPQIVEDKIPHEMLKQPAPALNRRVQWTCGHKFVSGPNVNVRGNE